MKKQFTLGLAGLLLATAPLSGFAQASPGAIVWTETTLTTKENVSYHDVNDENETLQKALNVLDALGIMEGDGNGNFRPEAMLARGEMVKTALAMQGLAPSGGSAISAYTDVPTDSWAAPYIEMATAMGLVEGNGDGTFEPEREVTYAEAVKVIFTILGYTPFAMDNGGYPTGYMAGAMRYGVLDGVPSQAFTDPISRSSLAIMLYNALTTPVMDRVSYGADAAYTIYDGNQVPFVCLLSRDFGIELGSGAQRFGKTHTLPGDEAVTFSYKLDENGQQVIPLEIAVTEPGVGISFAITGAEGSSKITLTLCDCDDPDKEVSSIQMTVNKTKKNAKFDFTKLQLHKSYFIRLDGPANAEGSFTVL